MKVIWTNDLGETETSQTRAIFPCPRSGELMVVVTPRRKPAAYRHGEEFRVMPLNMGEDTGETYVAQPITNS